MERRRLAAKWLQTEHDWFAKMSASRRRSIGCRFCKGFSLKITPSFPHKNGIA